MQRTTIMADDDLLDRLRHIAHQERVSLAEVIRQGMEWRAQQRRRLSFIGARRSTKPGPTAREASDVQPEPRTWR